MSLYTSPDFAKQVSKRLYALDTAILEKTGSKPGIDASMRIRDDQCDVVLYCTKGDDRYHVLAIAKGETPEDTLDAADAIIAALPNSETAKLHRHMARVADCIDKGHADGIADEFVTPLRMTVKAMSDNLLAAPQVPA